MLEIHYAVSENPIFKPKDKALPLLKDYFELMMKIYEFPQFVQNRQISNHLFSGILMGVCAMYKEQTNNEQKQSKSTQISQNFTQLVMRNYASQRNVAWYAEQLGITQAHLSTIIKQTTGKTCVEIITSMVIMDAKA
ncbi:transcriptional regulator, AraC, partial [gut metagenome]